MPICPIFAPFLPHFYLLFLVCTGGFWEREYIQTNIIPTGKTGSSYCIYNFLSF